jgi:hypothetical protein
LQLADQAATLSTDQPEKRTQFLVESSEDRYTVLAFFKTSVPARPRVDVRPVGADADRVDLTLAWHCTDSFKDAVIAPAILDCRDEFPCRAVFEVVATVEQPAILPVAGTLSIVIRREVGQCYTATQDSFLAVQQL